MKATAQIGVFRLLIEPESVAPELARRLLKESLDYLEVIQQILYYKFKHKSRKEILKMLGIEEEILRETKAFQEILQEGRLEGKIEGKLEGRLEGKIEGREEMLSKAVPLLRELGLTDGAIAEKLGCPIEKIAAIQTKSSRE